MAGSSTFSAFTALCLYDFQSEDPSEMSFRRGELLKIIDFGATGWWCAEGSNYKRGWVPAIYVQRVSDTLATMLKTAKEEADAVEAEEMALLNVDDAPECLQEKMCQHGTLKRAKRQTLYQKGRPRYHSNSIRAKRPYAPHAGTLESLVARLTAFPSKSKEEEQFRHLLLLSFSSFTTAEKLLEMLIAKYETKPPGGLNSEEMRQWRSKVLEPAQVAVLSLLSDWLERYGLLEDDPQLIPKLLWFLSRVYDTSKPRVAQEHIAPSLEHVFCFRKEPPEFPNPTRPRWHRKVSLAFLPIPEREIAEQLVLHDATLYGKIRPRECLAWTEPDHHIGAVRNLSAFITNSKRIQNWVRYSILGEDRRLRRAHTIDRWIRIAQHCKEFNDYTACVAIITALTSPGIKELHRTFASITMAGQLTFLRSVFSPDSNFQNCREVLQGVKGPCVPFMDAYLTELVNIERTYDSNVDVPISKDHPNGLRLINFSKSQRKVDVIDAMLRHQYVSYDTRIQFKPRTNSLVCERLLTSNKGEEWFVARATKIEYAEHHLNEGLLDSAPMCRLLKKPSQRFGI